MRLKIGTLDTRALIVGSVVLFKWGIVFMAFNKSIMIEFFRKIETIEGTVKP